MSTTEMNITPSAITNMCDEKCLFSYSYPIVNTLNISNNGNNYVITYSSSNPPVTFNNLGYNLQNVSIYFPSLHTFNNTSEVGEIVMNHVCQTNQSNQLSICIPVLSSGGVSCPLFTDIIGCCIGQSSYNPEDTSPVTSSSTSYSLPNADFNTFINLVSSPTYYYYNESSTQDVIVFSLTSGISLPSDFSSVTTYVTPSTTILFPSVSQLYYNSDGPTVDYGDGDIYIDCQPVNQSNETILDLKNTSNIFSSTTNIFGINTTLIEILGIFLLCLCISYGIYFGVTRPTPTKQTAWMNKYIQTYSNLWSIYKQNYTPSTTTSTHATPV
jgi:hypothetical protein